MSEGELERRVRGLREKYGAETNIAAFHKSWASLDLDARRKWIEDAKSMGESIALGGPNPSNQPILARVLSLSLSLSLSLFSRGAPADALPPPFPPTAVKEGPLGSVCPLPADRVLSRAPRVTPEVLESPPSMSPLLRGALLGSGMAVPLPPHLGGHGGKEDYVRMAARLGPRLATAEEERAFEAFHGRVWESCRAYFMCCFAVALCKRAALP